MDNKNAVLKALHELGFRYKVNDYDVYEFCYETFHYQCRFDQEDDSYVSFNVPNIYFVEDPQYRPIILETINDIHNTMKIAKVTLVKDSVWVNYEMRIVEGMDLEEAIRYAIMNLMAVTEKFAAMVNGGGIPRIGN